MFIKKKIHSAKCSDCSLLIGIEIILLQFSKKYCILVKKLWIIKTLYRKLCAMILNGVQGWDNVQVKIKVKKC